VVSKQHARLGPEFNLYGRMAEKSCRLAASMVLLLGLFQIKKTVKLLLGRPSVHPDETDWPSACTTAPCDSHFPQKKKEKKTRASHGRTDLPRAARPYASLTRVVRPCTSRLARSHQTQLAPRAPHASCHAPQPHA
jgi:hypothetical protein